MIQKNISLKQFTKFSVGGKARYFAHVKTQEQLIEVVRLTNDKNLPWYVIGFGSNLIIDDADFNGIVIKLEGEFNKILFSQNSVFCGAGFSLIRLGHLLAAKGFSKYEYMAVIPGSVGGAVLMNAGTTKHGAISSHFVQASVLDPIKETIIEYKKKDMNFADRFTTLQSLNNIVLNAEFKLIHENLTDPKQIKLAISNIWKQRMAKQPQAKKTFGSIFKKSKNSKPAGWYLEQVGMKGFRVGDAIIPHEHANWIVNLANATAADVKIIINIAQKRVFDEYGVKLEREVIYLPKDALKWE